MKVTKVNKIPKWLRKGIGVNGGGDYIGSQVIDGEERRLYMCWAGINGTVPYPAYFKIGKQWYRISHEDIDLIEVPHPKF